MQATTLLIVGGCEAAVIGMNRAAYEELICIKRLAIAEGATHLFNAPGKFDEVAELAALWYEHHLA